MEQEIRFCTSADGTRLAYATVGSGTPIVYVAPWLSHLEHDWNDPDKRTHFEALARHHTLVRYDKQGCGLSDRNRTDLSLDGEVRILESLIEHIGIKRLALLGISQAGPVAVAYAVKHTQHVSHVILYGSYARGADIATDEFKASLLSMIRAHWGVGSRTLADLFVPDTDAETVENFARFQRESATAEMAAQLLALTYEIDVSDLLPKVTAPTVVIHRERDRAMPFRLGRELASLLPHARLIPLEGRVHPPWLGDGDAVARAILEFLGDPIEAEEPTTEPDAALPEGMTAILFLDIADSTALTTKLGDAAYRERERELDKSLRAAITEAGGSPVEGKVLGDGVMAVFTSARQAIDAAQRCRDLGNEADLPLHLGIHAGDVVREGNNVHGGAVQVAARVQSVAAPGEVLVSDTVRSLARTSAGVAFEDRGEHELKGIPEPQRLFAVREQD